MSFSEAILERKRAGFRPVIPDLKARSPKEGDLFAGRSAISIALRLKNAGAPALSVVTETKYFGGSIKTLSRVAAATGLPVLRKDFLSEIHDLEETRAAGASAVLLICRILTPQKLRELFKAAYDLGLEALVETCSVPELTMARELNAPLVGINNRNILALERDSGGVERTCRLIPINFSPKVMISESGIGTPADVQRVLVSGATAALIGTALLRASDPAEFYKKLSGMEES